MSTQHLKQYRINQSSIGTLRDHIYFTPLVCSCYGKQLLQPYEDVTERTVTLYLSNFREDFPEELNPTEFTFKRDGELLMCVEIHDDTMHSHDLYIAMQRLLDREGFCTYDENEPDKHYTVYAAVTPGWTDMVTPIGRVI